MAPAGALLIGASPGSSATCVTWEGIWCCKEFAAHLGDVAGDGPRVDYGYFYAAPPWKEAVLV